MSESRIPARTELWPVTWQAARDALLNDGLAATPAQRLQWLEEALTLAYREGALPPPETNR